MTASAGARQGIEITLESARFDCDGLRVRRVSGSTAIGRPYAFDVEVVCLDPGGIDLDAVLGEDVSIVFSPSVLGDEAWSGVQKIHGMVAEADDRLDAVRDRRLYRLRVAPRMDRLALCEGQDVFLGQSVPDLLTRRLDDVGLVTGGGGDGGAPDVVLRLEETYAPRDIVVQYRETHLAFVSRLAEHLGIAYFFLHDEDFEQVVFTDHLAGFAGATSDARIPYGRATAHGGVHELEARRRLVPRRFVVHDYNYRLPQVELTASNELEVGFAGDVVEYGAHVKTPDEAAIVARARAEERQADELVYVGASDVPALRPGLRITVTDHPQLGDVELLVVEVSHEASQAVGHGGDDAGAYRNTFRAIPADRMPRPARVTPKPRIASLVTGVIQQAPGDPGTYARLDDQGRYFVRFLFDGSEQSAQPSSHPVRMLQNHVGENYGTHFPLKPGVEVLLGFVDGDPDRPLIVGAVPNPLTPSPVTAEDAYMHRIKTSTGTIIECR